MTVLKPELKEAAPDLYNQIFSKESKMKAVKPIFGINYRENKAG